MLKPGLMSALPYIQTQQLTQKPFYLKSYFNATPSYQRRTKSNGMQP